MVRRVSGPYFNITPLTTFQVAVFSKWPVVVLFCYWPLFAMVAEEEQARLVREGWLRVYQMTFVDSPRNGLSQYNYLMSAALDGGSQVIFFILSFAVFGAGGMARPFPTWWGNPATLSADRCKSA